MYWNKVYTNAWGCHIHPFIFLYGTGQIKTKSIKYDGKRSASKFHYLKKISFFLAFFIWFE